MDKKTVLCIGGASGMGRGIAEAAIARGANVIITSRTPEKSKEVAAEIGCRGLSVDITDSSSVEKPVQAVGPMDYLAITAGATGRTSLSETPPEEARAFLDAKLWATHLCLWAARPYLEDDGSITLITGGYSTAVSDDAGHVHVAFQATEALARAAAVSFAPIRCNVVRPGSIDSSL